MVHLAEFKCVHIVVLVKTIKSLAGDVGIQNLDLALPNFKEQHELVVLFILLSLHL